MSSHLLIDHSKATAYNYLITNRKDEAQKYLDLLNDPVLTQEEFGVVWNGQCLDEKSIEVFCDQGMGDIINILRYLNLIKSKWKCKVVLTCYAHYSSFCKFMKHIDYVDEFTKYHKKCDYFVNFFSLPTILSGIKVPFQYPAHFKNVLENGVVPEDKEIDLNVNSIRGKVKVGVSWRSNPDNNLHIVKTISDDDICCLKSDCYDLISLDPDNCLSFMHKREIQDLLDTAKIIKELDYVVSVDTVVLHLSGFLKVKTYGLIPDDCDPRWEKSSKTKWYPTVELFYKNGDWVQSLNNIKMSIEKKCLMSKIG